MSAPSVRPLVRAPSRREFIKRSSALLAGGAVGGPLTVARAAHAFGGDAIRVGLVGCGRRGAAAVADALNTQGGDVRLVALADAFADRLQASYRGLKSRYGRRVDVPRDRQFVGLEGYCGVLQSQADLVILAAPPAFRPQHLAAAVEAGKHVFMEKPVAVDAPGVRRVLAAAEEAKNKGLAVQVGLQRRHERRYRETIQRLHDGEIGKVLMVRVYWNSPGGAMRPRRPDWSELEFQLRNWHHFAWLSGDQIVEQHIHNLDVGNWLQKGCPIEACGMGGRHPGRGREQGQVFDHHFCEFTYADGSKMLSQCRQMPNCWRSVAEHAHGTLGSADISGGKIYQPNGVLAWRFGKGGGGGHQEEHHHLFADLRAGRVPNEAEYGAMSTMTAVLGRLATYSGQLVRMEDALRSGLSLSPPPSRLGSLHDPPPVLPDQHGCYPVAMPGETRAV